MNRTRRALALVTLSAAALAACDTASVYEDCTLESKVGSGEGRCPPSTFPVELDWGRQVSGTVSAGDERVANALLRVGDHLVSADESGAYRVPFAPLRYDVIARLPEDVVTYRGVGYRYIDLAIERDVPLRAWTSRLAVKVEGGPRPGHELVFFGGPEVVGLAGDAASGLVVSTRTFDTEITVHVVEIPEGGELTRATAHGSTKARTEGGGTAAAAIALTALEPPRSTTFAVEPPAGLVLGDVEVTLDFGTRRSERLATRVPLDVPLALPSLPGARWSAHLEARRADAAASSGRVFVEPGKDVELTLFDPPTLVAPAEAAVAEGRTLSASGGGVFEHVLVPLDGQGHTIRVVTAEAEARVPDLTEVTLPRATGRYAWTVRSFPDFAFVDALSGLDVRLYRARSSAGPRTVFLP